jgi:hypothetical protein
MDETSIPEAQCIDIASTPELAAGIIASFFVPDLLSSPGSGEFPFGLSNKLA